MESSWSKGSTLTMIKEKTAEGITSFLKGYKGFLLKALLTAVLFLFILSRIQLDLIVSLFVNVSIPFFILGSSLFIINLYFQYKKWALLSGEVLKVSDTKAVIESLFFGHALGAFTPVRAGEYVGRKIPYNNTTIGECTAATLLDKTSGLLFIYIFGIIALAGNLITKGVGGKEEFLYNGSILLIFALAIIVLISLLLWFTRNRIMKITAIQNFVESVKNFRSLSPVILIKLCIYSFIVVLSFSAQFALLAKSFSPSYSISDLFWIGSIMFFLKSLIPPVTIGELGVRESVTIFSLSFANVTEAAAFNVSMSMFFTNIVVPALVGLMMMWMKKK